MYMREGRGGGREGEFERYFACKSVAERYFHIGHFE